jgi:hypothetical protein
VVVPGTVLPSRVIDKDAGTGGARLADDLPLAHAAALVVSLASGGIASGLFGGMLNGYPGLKEAAELKDAKEQQDDAWQDNGKLDEGLACDRAPRSHQ